MKTTRTRDRATTDTIPNIVHRSHTRSRPWPAEVETHGEIVSSDGGAQEVLESQIAQLTRQRCGYAGSSSGALIVDLDIHDVDARLPLRVVCSGVPLARPTHHPA
jgi:hypothetical protein